MPSSDRSESRYASWVAVDWGTTHLRAWAIDSNAEVLDKASSAEGMNRLQPDRFEAALLDVIVPWLRPGVITPVLICGMAGARQGWIEAPYESTPWNALGQRKAVIVPTNDPRLQVAILSGVRQSEPDDVMRGEETQAAGFLHSDPAFEGMLCLPGTHTKWVNVSQTYITGFQTYMSGELFTCIQNHTVLRHSVSADGWNDDAFLEALEQALHAPAKIAAHLFSVRAEQLLADQSGDQARAKISGYILGTELAAVRDTWEEREIAVIGDPHLSAHYARAIEVAGGGVRTFDGVDMVLLGLIAAKAGINLVDRR